MNAISRSTPRYLLLVASAFALVALFLMQWRWGGTIEDSKAYFDTARYLRGELGHDALRAPFPYRIAVPALVAIIPFEPRATFAFLNWLFVWGAAWVLAIATGSVFPDRKRALMAGLLLIVSFPTFWYAPYLLVDPGSVFTRSLFVLGVLSGRPWLAQGAALAATSVREENVLLLVWLLLTRRVSVSRGLALLGIAGLWMVGVRWFVITGLPHYAWTPSVGQVIGALHDWKSIASIAAACGLVVPLALLGWRQAPPAVRPLASLIGLMLVPALYAFLCVRIDGRVIWGLYPFLIPFAVSALSRK